MQRSQKLPRCICLGSNPEINPTEVDVLTSAVNLEDIAVGDQLMVMNGVIIGLLKPSMKPFAAVIAARQAALANGSALKPALPPVEPPEASKAPRRGSRDELRAKVITVLREAPEPLTAHKITKVLQKRGIFDPIAGVMNTLRDRGVIVPNSKDRFPAYRLAEGATNSFN